MKKVVAKFLLGILLMSLLVSGCGEKEIEKEENKVDFDIPLTTAEDILIYTWIAYDKEEQFEIVGGNMENEIIGSMGDFSMDAVEEMDDVLGIPEKAVQYVENAASMKAKTDAYEFTCGAFYIKDSAQVNDFQKLVKENIMKKDWSEQGSMFEAEPEKLVIATVFENYVVVTFGEDDKVDTFIMNLKAVMGAKIVTDINLNE